jgi:hypothetical protein
MDELANGSGSASQPNTRRNSARSGNAVTLAPSPQPGFDLENNMSHSLHRAMRPRNGTVRVRALPNLHSTEVQDGIVPIRPEFVLDSFASRLEERHRGGTLQNTSLLLASNVASDGNTK